MTYDDELDGVPRPPKLRIVLCVVMLAALSAIFYPVSQEVPDDHQNNHAAVRERRLQLRAKAMRHASAVQRRAEDEIDADR